VSEPAVNHDLSKPPAKAAVLGIPVSVQPIDDFAARAESRAAGHALTISFVNPYACYLARTHDDYTDLLAGLDMVACDGVGMVAAARLAGLSRVKRESFDFTSMAGPVFSWASESAVRVQLVGGQEGVARCAARELEQLYPSLKIVACYSGFGDEPNAAIAQARSDRVGLIVCGMGAPRQERHLAALRATGWAGIGITCGGFFDQISSGPDYYPPWVDRFNLRFAYRLVREPRRLWRRYLLEYRYFLLGLAGLAFTTRWRRRRDDD
jgi:N-acetylglucosaminyldiphosphoundecaprenol N-acetyl-beta-D-mannosaminyltransferase